MTIYSYTIGGNGTDSQPNLGSKVYSSSDADYATLAAKFNIDTSWFKSNGSGGMMVDAATATAAKIFTVENPLNTNNDAYVQVGNYSGSGGANAKQTADVFRVDSNGPTGDGNTYGFSSGQIGLTGNSTTGYDYSMNDAKGDLFNIHFTGTPTGGANDYSYGAGLTLDNSKSYFQSADNKIHFFEKDDTIVCFAKGTLISTVKGLVAVEKLKAGDQVLTIDGEHAPIVWLGHRRVNCLKHSQPELANPVRVSKDAFGPGMPSADVFLSPAHAVYAYGHLVPVRHLINDVTITQEARDSITYYHIELPKHTVIFAQGLPAETYLDSDNRQFFISADQVASNVEALDTVEFSENYGRDLYLANCYAPFVTEGPVLEAIQEKLMGMPAAARLAEMAIAA